MKKKGFDILKRSIISVLGIAFLAYILYLFMNSQVIVQGEYANLNALFYVLLFLIFGYKVFFFGIKPKTMGGMKMTKATLIVIGLVLILLGHYVLLNDPTTRVYVGDLVKVFGVAITLMGPTGLLITHEAKKKQQESKMEIIEA